MIHFYYGEPNIIAEYDSESVVMPNTSETSEFIYSLDVDVAFKDAQIAYTPEIWERCCELANNAIEPTVWYRDQPPLKTTLRNFLHRVQEGQSYVEAIKPSDDGARPMVFVIWLNGDFHTIHSIWTTLELAQKALDEMEGREKTEGNPQILQWQLDDAGLPAEGTIYIHYTKNPSDPTDQGRYVAEWDSQVVMMPCTPESGEFVDSLEWFGPEHAVAPHMHQQPVKYIPGIWARFLELADD
jgi:hypothetical protein